MTDQHAGPSLRGRTNQFVRAPIERVYAAYVDPKLLPKWLGLQAITDVSGPLDRPGTRFVEVVFGPYRPRSEVFAAERPTLHEMGGRSAFGSYRWTTRFAEKDDGTEITLDAEVRLPASLIGRLLYRTQADGRMERGTQRRLAHFAKLVEAGET